MTNTYFVIRTNTEVGKTIASCALFQVTGQLGLRTVGYKSMASGSEMTAEGLWSNDALALQRNSVMATGYAAINPYTFAEPASPHIISADEGRPVQASVVSAGLRLFEEQADWVLVGGAGRWFTPLSPTLNFSDWVKAEQLPVILVVDVKPGCINHAILTAQAVQQAGLTLAEWVVNDVQPPDERHAEYMATLKRALVAPLLGRIPWLAENPGRATTGRYIDLSVLSLTSISRRLASRWIVLSALESRYVHDVTSNSSQWPDE